MSRRKQQSIKFNFSDFFCKFKFLGNLPREIFSCIKHLVPLRFLPQGALYVYIKRQFFTRHFVGEPTYCYT